MCRYVTVYHQCLVLSGSWLYMPVTTQPPQPHRARCWWLSYVTAGCCQLMSASDLSLVPSSAVSYVISRFVTRTFHHSLKQVAGKGIICGMQWIIWSAKNVAFFIYNIFGQNQSASNSAYSSVARSCLSVVCHICAPCLNHSTDLDAIWQVHLWGPMTHCVRWGSDPQEKGRFGVEPQPKLAFATRAQPQSVILHFTKLFLHLFFYRVALNKIPQQTTHNFSATSCQILKIIEAA